MVLVNKAKSLISEVFTYWKVPAKGNYVSYKEYMMLSIGWLGMRLATTFGIGFSVNDPFTAMTLHMTHRDLVIFGYICTGIGYALAPLNAYIIDNLKSRIGKYKVYTKLAIPTGILSLIALFFPYEKMSYVPMVISLFLLGQVQGYIKNWYSTGVSNLVFVISPNSKERVNIMMVSSLVHNFAPSLTGLLIPILSDVFAGGDLYNINTYRLVYPVIIVIGVFLSMTTYSVNERIVEPKARTTSVSLIDALRDVAKNKLFWIKCSDNWNNFMEDSKNVLMQWLFYYGKVGSMTMYGIFDTVSYNSSMWAMLFSPKMIELFGKKGFKLVKNISQVFITLGLLLTYKRSLACIFIFYFLNRFWETTEVIDRSIESDIRDYQQYISGERIDGSFGVIDTYVGGAIGAATNLFVPWVYKKNGFDGTDYSVLNVYNDKGVYNPNNILYTLLDKLLKISLVGAIIDILPWFFYDLSETDQKSIVRTVRIRSTIEDRNAGITDDEGYCEACEAIISMKEYIGKDNKNKLTTKDNSNKKEIRKANKETQKYNEEIDIARFLNNEISRYNNELGKGIITLCKMITSGDKTNFFSTELDIEKQALSLPQGTNKEETALRGDAIRMSRAIKKSEKQAKKYYSEGFREFNISEYESLYNLPETTKEERNIKNKLIKEANHEKRIYGRVMKPYIWAERNILLSEVYNDIDDFIIDYNDTKERVEAKQLHEKEETERILAERKNDIARRKASKKIK